MSEYLELQKQIAALQEKAALVREKERREAIAQINALVQTFDIQASELQFSQAGRGAGSKGRGPTAGALAGARKRHPSAGTTLPVKYRDDQGHTWTGRGVLPRWLREAIAAGRTLESFAVPTNQA